MRSGDGRWGGAAEDAAGKSGESLLAPGGVTGRASSEERRERAPRHTQGVMASSRWTADGTGKSEKEKQYSERCTRALWMNFGELPTFGGKLDRFIVSC